MNYKEFYEKFKKDFPSFNNDDWDEGGGYMQESIQEYCIDKQRVLNLINKLEKTKGTGLFSDRNWCEIMKSELGLDE